MVGAGIDESSTALVHALIELGNALGLKTVAEGIETADQLLRLEQEGCDAGQGFYFSRPLEDTDAERFLADAAKGRGTPELIAGTH
jgi:EAL domain-containing protein (putative c-di-GMP-specific phosphodiesterase class I)